jgi:hypothetical protein
MLIQPLAGSRVSLKNLSNTAKGGNSIGRERPRSRKRLYIVS